jgi:hypothetical protein
MKLFGFQEMKDENGEVVFKMNSSVSGTFIKGRKLDFD